MKIATLVFAGSLMLLSVRAVQAQQVVMFSSDLAPVRSQLFIANGDGTGERPLLPLAGLDYSPSISADGKWVIFTSERDGSADIYRVHLDGLGPLRNRSAPYVAFSLTPSPIVFLFVIWAVGWNQASWITSGLPVDE